MKFLIHFLCIQFFFSPMRILANEPEIFSKKLLPGNNLPFFLHDQISAFYFGHSGSTNQLMAEGFSVQGIEFLEDYLIKVDDEILDRRYASTEIFNLKLVRHYFDNQIVEEVELITGENLMLVTLKSPKKCLVSLYPGVSLSADMNDYILHWHDTEHIVFVAQRKHLIRSLQEDYPVWIGMTSLPEPIFVSDDKAIQANQLSEMTPVFIPGRLSFQMDSVAVIIFAVGDIRDDIIISKRQTERKFQFLVNRRGQKLNPIWRREFQKSFYQLKPQNGALGLK
ncbi:hypothetical protein JW964_15060 [candidate division KSB1 bacterium]|nr:hypothetical protein [candidate division KSB1 bacterium]